MDDNRQSLSTIVTGSSLDLSLSEWFHKHGKRIEQEVIYHTRTSKAYEETILLYNRPEWDFLWYEQKEEESEE